MSAEEGARWAQSPLTARGSAAHRRETEARAGGLKATVSLWTSWRVADLIEQECGVKYQPLQAWRILRQLGWSCQRPVGRALERGE